MEAVKRIIDGAREWTPEPPRPLHREMPPADPFPVDALGKILGDAAQGIHDRTQAPLAICAQSVLAAASLAVQAHADVELPTRQARPISGFFLTIAGSGERKSACDSEALWPVRKREDALRGEHEVKRDSHANDRDAWQKQREQILNDKTKYPDQTAKRIALNDLGAAPTPPLQPLILCEEPTLEGLIKMLDTGQPSVGVFSAEGGQFIGGHGMSAENKLRTAAGLSNAWDGAPIKRVRAGDGALILPGRRVSVHLMAQPEVSAGMLSDRVLMDQGLLSRFLVTAPESAAGTRFWRDAKPESDAAIKRYGARLLSILEAPFPLAEGKGNELAPRRVTLSDRARSLWIGFADHLERGIAPGGDFEPIRGLANKLPEHAARLAAVLALVDDIDAGTVSPDHMAAGIELAQHYAGEALRLFNMGAIDPDIRLAERLLTWLRTAWEEELVSLPDIYQRGLNAIRDKATAERMVKILADHGWLEPVPGPVTVNGQKRRGVWRIVKEG